MGSHVVGATCVSGRGPPIAGVVVVHVSPLLILRVLRTTPTARKPLATDKPTDIANVPSSFDTFTVPLCPTHPKRKAILAVVLDLKPKRIVVESVQPLSVFTMANFFQPIRRDWHTVVWHRWP
jgi:hypothetical protein